MRQSSEVIDVVDRRPFEVDKTSERGAPFLRLANEHLDASYRLARAILRDPGEAQDASHDAFVQAWRKWSTLRDPARFEHWFDRILVNTCRNRLQHASRRQATDISAEVALAAGDPIGQAHDRDLLGAAIATLTPDHRVVVALRYYRDLTIEEIASRLEIPVLESEVRPIHVVAPPSQATPSAFGALKRSMRESMPPIVSAEVTFVRAPRRPAMTNRLIARRPPMPTRSLGWALPASTSSSMAWRSSSHSFFS